MATENENIQLWDLRAIRGALAGMGLDWDQPPYSADAAPSGSRLRLELLADTIEAENLRIVAAEKCPYDVRDTSERGLGAWSNDRELYGEAGEGGYLELEIEVSRKGRYALAGFFTQGPEFGLVAVSVDGQRIGPRFDGFAEVVARSGKTNFGTLALHEGAHRLRVTAVGKNSRATMCHLAIDCLELIQIDDDSG